MTETSDLIIRCIVVESLSALASCLQKFIRFPRFFAPGYSFWRRTRIHRDPGSKIFFRRAVHVQSFQSPCTCTARRVLPSDFTPFDRANQELVESLSALPSCLPRFAGLPRILRVNRQRRPSNLCHCARHVIHVIPVTCIT